MIKTVTIDAAWSGEADCSICKLRDTALFAGLDGNDFETIHKPIEQTVLESGSTLYRSGDKAEHLYTIRSGLVKLVQYLPDGTQRIVRLLRTSDVAGMEALLGGVYQHDAIVMQATETCDLPAEVVKRLSRENSRLHEELMKRWQRALEEADLWITQLSTGSARRRVARLLQRLVCNAETHECQLFNREDMGAMLGITTETASRTIADFKRSGVLTEKSHNFYTVNMDKIHELTGD